MHRYSFLIVAALAALSSAQYQKAKDAAILSDARYLTGDGQFGAAYSQEDGVEFKEESDGEGNRRGSYSYVDPSGQRRTVTYTAGKNGFQATGDHLPQAPPAPPQPAPRPSYTPLPQYNPPEESWNTPAPAWDQPTPAPQQWNPPQQQSWNTPAPAPQWNPPAPQQQQWNPPPQQPQYNPPAQQWTTTPAPHRFYPPGKLSLNRSPDGFSYTFSKN
uniref:Cuticle protein 2 n=1 Tax=Nilaparvata lugens TaxID=108931 RepID=A0A2Z4HVJ9_NILLU|nr:cuticle protein 2 [Nilaparvata lugens]